MSKSNVYNWIKKILQNVENNQETEAIIHSQDICELDELYWFVGQKSNKETKENVYVITMVGRNPSSVQAPGRAAREPRQIIGFDVAADKSPERIQAISR